MAKQRVPFWDTLKAILIVLVVLGHTGTALGDKWLSVIYAFHMPLFIFVSGYFSKRKPLNEIGEGIKRLIIIYIVFDLAYVALDVVTGSGFSISRLLTPSFALWYILSLIYWRIVLQILPQQWLDKKWLIIFVTLAISIGAGWIPISKVLSFQRACSFLPFFFIGYYARQEGWVDKLRQWNKMPFVLLFIGLSALCYFILPVFYSNKPYVSIADGGIRSLQLGVATLFCIAALNITPKTMGRFTDVH